MQPRIAILTEKKLVGKRLITSLVDDKTFELWRSFMPGRKEITNAVHTDLYSVQVFPSSFDFSFSNTREEFEKWAAIEVDDIETSSIPSGMEMFILRAGLYAVFDYKGLSTDTQIFKYIFGEWLPKSEIYLLDDRPHFEILGDRYKNNDPDSEEEIWIPVKAKSDGAVSLVI
jgi:AraC family transcriptional regulator